MVALPLRQRIFIPGWQRPSSFRRRAPPYSDTGQESRKPGQQEHGPITRNWYKAGFKKARPSLRGCLKTDLGCTWSGEYGASTVLLLTVVVHPADIQDRQGARLALVRLVGRFPRLRRIWADGAYAGKLIPWVRKVCGWDLELVRRPPDQDTFEVLPHRWVVERTFAWLGRYRRLSKDYEELPQTTEAWIYVAMTGLMLRRLANSNAF